MKKIFTILTFATLNLINAQNVTTFAGTGTSGSANGIGTAASFNNPYGMVFDATGNLFVSDRGNHQIRKITPTGEVTTFAGNLTAGNNDGTGAAASFNQPGEIKIDVNGNLFVADRGNHKIRKITPTGVVTTFAGSGVAGNIDGTGTAARFNAPTGIAIDATGNLYVAEAINHQIRKITPTGVVTTLAGTGMQGSTDGIGTAASFFVPTGLVIDDSGNIYVAESGNHKIRKITPTGVVTTFAGSGTAGSIDATGTAARFNNPYTLTRDGSGNLYVADFSSKKIRKITPTGVVTTYAGTGTNGNSNGPAASATFSSPIGVVFNATGYIYVTDFANHNIRKIEDASLGLSENNLESNLVNVYPNPSNGIFTIESEGNNNIEIYDIVGKQIAITTAFFNTLTIDLSSYNSGIYFAKITNQNNQTKTVKLIKQ